jgi:putative DNA methylase
MTDQPRLIEVAFPLKQASLDSVHEKNVRHGHISTLHIWPARRPLAASRAALIATLLPDPGNAADRKQMLERLGGRLVTKVKKKKLPDGRVEEQVSEETEGGILHWGRENSADLAWFREKIREAYSARAPRVLDPFAGGGAIPLEAMRLGCEVTAVDINPVAWFILKCTLEYPQRLAGQKHRLPDFALQSPEFMESYFKAKGLDGAKLQVQLKELGLDAPNTQPAQQQLTGIHTQVVSVEADLAWHVRAWGWWVLQKARADLERYYPVIDGKPTVAYLWARTVTCKNCRAVVPLLKTRWLCKKNNKRVALTMQPNADKTGVVFGIQQDVPVAKGTAAQKREADKGISGGTMSHSGVTCPCCGTIIRMEDIRLEGVAGRLSAVMTAIVVDGQHGKEYRLPMKDEIQMAAEAESVAASVFASIPLGLPEELVPKGGSGASRAFSVDGYGFDKWYKLFTPRQLLALSMFIKHTRAVRDAMREQGYTDIWVEAVSAYLACAISRLLDFCNCGTQWKIDVPTINHSFVRFALPISWDYAEGNTIGSIAGSYSLCYERICIALDTYQYWGLNSPYSKAMNASAIAQPDTGFDVIITDPPYYDAIPYSDLMDFFFVWLRRTLYGLSPEFDAAFSGSLAPKWDHEHNDGELIDDSSRFGGDKHISKANYENGMFRVFQGCYKSLTPDGRLVIVFAHKQPDAWETLVSAIIKAGFVVDGSWPIQTEQTSRMRAQSSAALASSVWLVCKKRSEMARPGWDTRVLEEMQERIVSRLHDFWDAGIRGPDFVWSATGPALEVYSQHPIVKKTNEPGQVLSVSEFLRHVRRIVVDFVVGRVLSHNGGADAVSGLDDVTTYYLLHRYDFGMASVPIGPCILYAVSCGLSDSALITRYDMLAKTGGQVPGEAGENDEDEVESDDGETEEGTSSTVRLKQWNQRKSASLGYDAASQYVPRVFGGTLILGGTPAPLIDQVHRLMHLWKSGDVIKVDEYLDMRGLGHSTLFLQLLQALIELAPAGSEERALLESISNHVGQRGSLPVYPLGLMD